MITDFALIAPVSENRFHITPVYLAGPVHDELGGARLVADLYPQACGSLEQQVDHHGGTAGVARHGYLVPARCRHRQLQEWPHLLISGEHQALGVGLNHSLAGKVTTLELKTQALQPVEMLDAAVAIGANLVVIGLSGDRDQVLVHLLG